MSSVHDDDDDNDNTSRSCQRNYTYLHTFRFNADFGLYCVNNILVCYKMYQALMTGMCSETPNCKINPLGKGKVV